LNSGLLSHCLARTLPYSCTTLLLLCLTLALAYSRTGLLSHWLTLALAYFVRLLHCLARCTCHCCTLLTTTSSAEGIELQIGTNHFGHFLLTTLLLPIMANTTHKASMPGTIVAVSSAAHYDSYPEGRVNTPVCLTACLTHCLCVSLVVCLTPAHYHSSSLSVCPLSL